jgi:hypothetical protein
MIFKRKEQVSTAVMHPAQRTQLDWREDLESGPVVSRVQTPMPASFVGAQLAKREPVTIDAPAWMTTTTPQDLTRALQVGTGAEEHTSAMDRAKALRVRLVPFLALWGLLAVITFVVVLLVAQNAPGAALGGLLVFVALSSATLIKLNGQDYAHSTNGVERFKVATSADLTRAQMNHEQELRKMALDAWLKRMERGQ